MAGFNSRAHKGRDVTLYRLANTILKFQFTRPQGARPSFSFASALADFVSFHAPTRGATYLSYT